MGQIVTLDQYEPVTLVDWTLPQATGLVQWWPAGDYGHLLELVDGNSADPHSAMSPAIAQDGSPCWYFDGTGGPAISQSRLPINSDPMTWSAWVEYEDNAQIYGTVLNYGAASTYDARQILFQDSGGKFLISTYGTSSGDNTNIAGQWNHYAATFDGTTWRVYINGRLTDTDALTTTTSWSVGYIGRHFTANSYDLQGNLGDMRVYDYPMSQTEIQGLVINPWQLYQTIQNRYYWMYATPPIVVAAQTVEVVHPAATVAGGLTVSVQVVEVVHPAATVAGGLTVSVQVVEVIHPAATVAGGLTVSTQVVEVIHPAATVAGGLTVSTQVVEVVHPPATVAGGLTVSVQVVEVVHPPATVAGESGILVSTQTIEVVHPAVAIGGGLTVSTQVVEVVHPAATVAGGLTVSVQVVEIVHPAVTVAGGLTASAQTIEIVHPQATVAGAGAIVVGAQTVEVVHPAATVAVIFVALVRLTSPARNFQLVGDVHAFALTGQERDPDD